MKYDPLNDLIHAIPTSRLLLQKAHEEGALIERLCLYVSTIDALLRLALVYSRTQKAPNYTYTIPKETRGASAPIPSHLRWNRLGLLFATGNGTPWDADLVRKRKLYPLLEKLGIERCGFHAFRHGNETVMDGEGVPMATRQNRLGHSDARTTMRYTHVIPEDRRKIAARFGELLTCSPTAAIMPAGNE